MEQPPRFHLGQEAKSPVQLLFQLQSPMFSMDSLSPTFRAGLAGTQAKVYDVKQTGDNKPPSTKSILDTAASTPRSMPDGLSPMTKANECILTSKSTEMQNRMIDEQLEMLGELFPNQLKKLSNSQDQQAVETTITDSQVAHDRLSSGASSDFQDSPKTGRLALSSDWPKLADIEGDDSSTKRDSAGSSNTHVDPSTMHEVPSDIPLSPEKPLIERRSLAPTLRVDTVNSQQYATKELVLIRKMKEEGRVKSEIKAKAQAEKEAISQLPAAKPTHMRAGSVPETLRAATQVDVVLGPTVQVSTVADTAVQASEAPRDMNEVKQTKKAHRHSAESSISHIVWSAVVEKFSEMAQEIAGGKEAPGHAPSRLQTAHSAVRSSLLASDAALPSTVSEAETEDSGVKSPEIPPHSASTIAVSKTDDEEPTSLDIEDSRNPVLTLSNEPPELEISLTPDAAFSSGLLAIPVDSAASKGEGKMPKTRSIMKKTASNDSPEDGEVSDTPSAKTNKYNVIKLKRGRTVRVQSHHASIGAKVEGDYAAFLRSAAGGSRSKGEDATSLKSGKSNRSGRSAWSAKSGVENGCFRRGSMRSIRTGRTIATVGDVSIRDLSARFRHPNPFFSQQHGFRKIKAPHQAGPGVLRRKGSKIVRLSVYEGTSAPDTVEFFESKQRADEGETLGSALARIQNTKRKGPTPLIGELSFENDEPAKPRTQTPAPPRSRPERTGPKQAALSSANLAAYASSAMGNSSKPPSDPGLAKLAYAASAYASGSYGKSSSSISPAGKGYPCPAVAASLPPVPLVTMRGFPHQGHSAPGLPPLPPVPGSVMSSSSVISASRGNILGAQRRGAEMLKSQSQSNISVASTASLRRSKSPAATPRNRKTSHPTSEGMPNAVPMSRVEDNFISMTPARSDVTVKSPGGERSQRDQQSLHSLHAQGSSRAMQGSLPALPVLPEEMRASYKRKNEMRSSTAPLPNLPDDTTFTKPLPLRVSSGGQYAQTEKSRLSAHRPLTVDTKAAREQAEKQRQMKLQAEQREKARPSRSHSQSDLRKLDGMQLPFQQEFRQSSRVVPDEGPKTGISFSGKVTAMFTPRRPFREDSSNKIPVRVPRPPSAGALDPALEQFLYSANRQSTTSTTPSSMGGKTKAMKIFGGFGKSKKAA